jgi:hypothetical protein
MFIEVMFEPNTYKRICKIAVGAFVGNFWSIHLEWVRV